MSRQPRELSNSGVYHIIFRGINHENIFESSEDYDHMLKIIQIVKDELDFALYAYCCLSNHVHLVIKEQKIGLISLIMQKILTRYVMYYNNKYDRSGGLIGNRYKSKPVETEEYLLPLVAYVHRNPVAAGIAERESDYKYSSYNAYLDKKDSLVDTKFLLNFIDKAQYIQAHINAQTDSADYNIRASSKKKTEEEVRKIIIDCNGGREPHKLKEVNKGERDQILRQLRGMSLSIREIERATGISRGVIATVENRKKS